MKFIDNIVDRALDRIEPVITKQLTDFRADAMTLLQNELPKIAGAVAESAIKAVFDHTNIDAAANDVSAVITGILGQIPFLNVQKH
ncbi:hypothetical protein A5646_03415 [Mycobacterium sp. 1245499.0]|uniref:hypothetical protein n=1 Tax=Mycobacterium sp. 1245499.0 TaxID=1834074 RepID=UPI0007FFBDDF|nr:hypothetical protein [Mycobacterium sp. 1245499.0]OBK92367.1 hypothetical protein A5646_03415 [Mycobacterium sp. 1245499.0]